MKDICYVEGTFSATFFLRCVWFIYIFRCFVWFSWQCDTMISCDHGNHKMTKELFLFITHFVSCGRLEFFIVSNIHSTPTATVKGKGWKNSYAKSHKFLCTFFFLTLFFYFGSLKYHFYNFKFSFSFHQQQEQQQHIIQSMCPGVWSLWNIMESGIQVLCSLCSKVEDIGVRKLELLALWTFMWRVIFLMFFY